MFVLAVGLSCWQYFRSLGHSGREQPREGMERKTSSAAREREEVTDEEVDEVVEDEQQQEASV